jgi:hypothetical protein
MRLLPVVPTALLIVATSLRTASAQQYGVVPGTRSLTIKECLSMVSTETSEDFK